MPGESVQLHGWTISTNKAPILGGNATPASTPLPPARATLVACLGPNVDTNEGIWRC